MNKLEENVKSKASSINELIENLHFTSQICSKLKVLNTPSVDSADSPSQELINGYLPDSNPDSLFMNAFSDFDNWDAWDKNDY